MDKNVIAPLMAGIGLGFLAFAPEGQKLAKSLGQSVLPALTGGRDDKAKNGPKADKDDKDDEDSRKKDDGKEEEDS